MLLVICVPLAPALPVVVLFPLGFIYVASYLHLCLGSLAGAFTFLFYPTITIVLLNTPRRAVFWTLYSLCSSYSALMPSVS